MKFSENFEKDWDFYNINKDKFNFCGEDVDYTPDSSLKIVSPKEAFFIFDSTGKKHPTTDKNLLIGVIKCKKSINFHIKMWAEGYNEYFYGIDEYLNEFKNCQSWVKKALIGQILK